MKTKRSREHRGQDRCYRTGAEGVGCWRDPGGLCWTGETPFARQKAASQVLGNLEVTVCDFPASAQPQTRLEPLQQDHPVHCFRHQIPRPRMCRPPRANSPCKSTHPLGYTLARGTFGIPRDSLGHSDMPHLTCWASGQTRAHWERARAKLQRLAVEATSGD